MNKNGFALVLVIIIAAVITLIISAIMPQAIREANMSKRMTDSTRAFYAAESGVNIAIWALDNYEDGYEAWDGEEDYQGWTNGGWIVDISDPNLYILTLGLGSPVALTDATGNTVAYYDIRIELDPLDMFNSLAYSNGYSPTPTDAKRTIKVNLRKVAQPNSGLITNIIEATGDVDTGGSSTITGNVRGSSSFSFESIFGLSKQEMKNNYATVITNPENNYTPVAGVTWFVVSDPNSQVMITAEGWTGSGIMVVEGDLRITGGTFEGIIWVSGNCDLDVAGNSDINGAIFVEGDADVTGNATLTYGWDAIRDALKDAFPDDPISYWQELYPI